MTVLSRQVKINQREKACLPACTFYLRHSLPPTPTPRPQPKVIFLRRKNKTRFLQLWGILLLYVADINLTVFVFPRSQPLQKLPGGGWLPLGGSYGYPVSGVQAGGGWGGGGRGAPRTF
ncbi:unnamed protein product [Rangifer tarandus platyrhynchus]|uniref:Uncharacterized protein n=1 Tax=Rangifer tarandus platyrhynchus TaxID=3082113 RepID=A0AC59ZJP9_RANTA